MYKVNYILSEVKGNGDFFELSVKFVNYETGNYVVKDLQLRKFKGDSPEEISKVFLDFANSLKSVTAEE